jgi:hypothetical protein
LTSLCVVNCYICFYRSSVNEAQENVHSGNVSRALPPTPSESRVQTIATGTVAEEGFNTEGEAGLAGPSASVPESSVGGIDFAASIDKVKDVSDGNLTIQSHSELNKN